MNSECRSNSVHASPRPQQPQRPLLSLPKYAAAGDAPRGQISSDPNQITSTEIFDMNSSLLTKMTKDNRRVKNKLNDGPCAHQNEAKIWKLSNDILGNVVSMNGRDSSSIGCIMLDANLAETNDKNTILSSKSHTIENGLHCHVPLEREPPCKEYSYDIPRASDHKNLATNKQSILENSGFMKVITKDEKGIESQYTNEEYTVEKILSPDRKMSMFSKEIWTEKVLPIDTFACPEPEIVEIYFDKNKTTDQLKRIENYGVGSIDSSKSRRGSSRSVSRRSILIRQPLSGRKGKTLSSGQKTINFDDEIWPICPKLIPSGKELSISISESRHDEIAPEKLNETHGVTTTLIHPRCGSLQVARISDLSSRSGTKQYDLDRSSNSGKVIEPTHEIEGQDDFASTSGANSPSTISQVMMEEQQKFDYANRIRRRSSPVMNILDQTENDHFWEELPKPETSGAPGSSGKQRMRKTLGSSQTRISKKKQLSVSNSGPVSTVLRDILNQREIDFLHKAELPVRRCNEITSLGNVKVKHVEENYGAKFHACPKAETVKQESFIPIKNDRIVNDHLGDTLPASTDITCETFPVVDQLPQSSVLSFRNKMHEISVELSSRNQGNSRKIYAPKNHLTILAAAGSSELSAMRSGIIHPYDDEQEIEKNRKRVKVVRFETCGKRGGTNFDEAATELQENFDDRHIGPDHNTMHSDFDNMSDTLDCISVESFKQGIDQVANQIARQIEIDPALDDAVVTLAKIQIIVQANRQIVERLQQLQPNATIPRLTPPDAGKSIAKALMRCRHYMQNNGYSGDAMDTLNKLLTSTVQDLRQLVERQKLALMGRGRKRFVVPGGRRQSRRSRQENSVNTNAGSTAKEVGSNQMQCLISDILTLTEQIVPKLDGIESQKKSSSVTNYSHNGVNSSIQNRREIVNAPSAGANDTISSEGPKITCDGHAGSFIQSLGVPGGNRAKGEVTTDSVKPIVNSEAASNPRASSDHQNLRIEGHKKPDMDSETPQTPTMRSTYPKKIAPTDSTRTLKKLFNELWEKRSRTLPRHHNANDATNSRSLAGSHNATISQKLPAWKPGGNNLVQPSMSVIPNNPKPRPPSSAAMNKKKHTTSEHTRDTQQRTRATSGIVKNPSKTVAKKPVIKPYDTTVSLANCKIRTVPARGHYSEVTSLNKIKVPVAVEIDEIKVRKPRSKSRTRTRTPNNVSRVTVTEIPLEHADDCSPVTEKEIPVVNELPTTKKSPSSPKDIIQMLEELIKSSDNETSINNASSVQVVARCNVTIKDVNEDIEPTALLKEDVKLMNATDLFVSNDGGDHSTQEAALNHIIQSKSIEEIINESKNTTEMNDMKILIDEDEKFLREDLSKTCNLHKEPEPISSLNAEEISTVSRSNSKTTSNGSAEWRTSPSVSNVGCTVELSSGTSTGSVFSKCCQASLTSLTSQEISEEFISSRVSDTGVTSGCETQKDSHESFNAVEDDEVGREDSAQQFQQDQNPSAKKKFINKHARSLEMLKEILSDQGLGIHLLSRAENELKDKCKCSSRKRELAARRSLQGQNFGTSNYSGEPINRVPLLNRNFSTSLFTKLATLSESESDVEQVEVATMTSANDSALDTIESSASATSDSVHCSTGDGGLLRKIATVENATQFDITPKSDMCVGDGIICDTYGPFKIEKTESFATNFVQQHNLPATFTSSTSIHHTVLVNGSESSGCKLPDGIFDALQLAAVRANNFYTAINILKENVPNESRNASNSSYSNVILSCSSGTSKCLARSIETPCDAGEIASGHERKLSRSLNADCGVESPVIRIQNALTAAPARVITPRVQTKIDSETNRIHKKKSCFKELPRDRVARKNLTTFEDSNEKTTGYKLLHAHDPRRVSSSKPVVPPKSFSTEEKTLGTTVEGNTVSKEAVIDPDHQLLTVVSESPRNTEILQDAGSVQETGCQSPSSNQQSLAEGCITGEQIETLHFAKKRTAPAVRNIADSRLANFIESNPGSSNVQFASPKVRDKIKDSIAGSRIKNLLKENLQRFETDYNPIVHEKLFINFGDQLSTESSDDGLMISRAFVERTTSTSSTHIDVCTISSEVKDLVNRLLHEVEEKCESSTMPRKHDFTSHSPRHRHLKKHVRRSRSGRTKKTVQNSIPRGKYWNNSNERIVSREHLLFLIYAVICSFVFCCLQLSVHCEV